MTQTLKQSNINCIRNFRAWLYELKKRSESRKINIELERKQAEMYYNGGYSPKMTICDILEIPFEQ